MQALRLRIPSNLRAGTEFTLIIVYRHTLSVQCGVRLHF
jgi:hypothetical protein